MPLRWSTLERSPGGMFVLAANPSRGEISFQQVISLTRKDVRSLRSPPATQAPSTRASLGCSACGRRAAQLEAMRPGLCVTALASLLPLPPAITLPQRCSLALRSPPPPLARRQRCRPHALRRQPRGCCVRRAQARAPRRDVQSQQQCCARASASGQRLRPPQGRGRALVYGTSFTTSAARPRRCTARAERAEHGDFFFVDGRERLPHVGVVTEKSAAGGAGGQADAR